jgi:sarcosine oxidase subunit alpha
MSVRECRVAEVSAQLFRVSFTGEVGFEINVPSGFARFVWDSLLSIGEAFGITPYGTDAMRVLRAEKGYIMIGHETDGTVTPSDLGMDPREKQRDFIGKRSLVLDDLRRDGRRQLVGLLTVDRKIVLEEGAQIVAGAEPGIALGYVSSAYWSDTLQRSIALALVTGGCERIGTTLQVPTAARMIPIQVVPPCFYDQKGERLHV